MTKLNKRPVVLIIRDGWGHNPYPQWNHANAIFLARHPVSDELMANYPSTLIHTSGFDVGLPEATMGNSEVGHQNIGAGRIVDQPAVKITKDVRDGNFLANSELNKACDFALQNHGALHLFGIVSDAGVHGLMEHLYGCLQLAAKRGLNRVYLHAFTDGRDTAPSAGIGYIQQVQAKMNEIGVGRIATVSGRYYAMDRDNRWSRVEKAYQAIANGVGPTFLSATEAVQFYYDHPTEPTMTGDEFVPPSVIVEGGKPIATVNDGDAVIFYNYRNDRPKELTKAFVADTFDGFDRGPKRRLYFVTMTPYDIGQPLPVAYPRPGKLENTLGQYISDLGLRQFRCAETEKFPHVTFFFNDGREEPYPGEDRQIIPSPKDVSTYDQKPQMSAQGVADEVVKRIDTGIYDLVVVNFANPDMVGHTGNLKAAITAVEFVDAKVGEILQAVRRKNGVAIIFADHGNCEQMIDPKTGAPHTAHTIYDVDLIVVDDRFNSVKLHSGGRLADVAPTALRLMGLPQPPQMTGTSLVP